MTQSLSRLYLLYQKTIHYFNLLRSVALRFGNRQNIGINSLSGDEIDALLEADEQQDEFCPQSATQAEVVAYCNNIIAECEQISSTDMPIELFKRVMDLNLYLEDYLGDNTQNSGVVQIEQQVIEVLSLGLNNMINNQLTAAMNQDSEAYFSTYTPPISTSYPYLDPDVQIILEQCENITSIDTYIYRLVKDYQAHLLRATEQKLNRLTEF
ncbi:MAG: hypothetical protein ACK5UY_02240 [Holosporales bacterium]